MGDEALAPAADLPRDDAVCPCVVGWHAECINLVEHPAYPIMQVCCCWVTKDRDFGMGTMLEPKAPIDTRKVGKDDSELLDQTSTGRKRAAALYPIPSVKEGGMVCEWAFLSKAGGGAVPIVGCAGNRIADTKERIAATDGSGQIEFWPGNLHHGPDKSTLNNDPGNVHRICPVCHNRWHTLNDDLYGKRPEGGLPHLPLAGVLAEHDSVTKATEAELAWSEEYFRIPAKKRNGVPYRLEK